MKKILLFLFGFLLFFTSCDDNDGRDPSMIWDFVNYSIEFTVANTELLNDEEFLSKVQITYNGKKYIYSEENSYPFRTRATYCYPLAIRCYNPDYKKEAPNTILGFGEFRPDHNHKNQKFTIDWGNGRVDEIGFDIYITWRKNDPTIHKKLRVNGEERNFDDIIYIPI